MHCYYHHADLAGVYLCIFFFLFPSFFFFFFFLKFLSLHKRGDSFFFFLSPFSFIPPSHFFSSSSRDDARWLTKRLMARNVPSTSANLQCASGFRFLLILLISFDLSLRARYVLLLSISLRNEWNIHGNSFDRSICWRRVCILRDRPSFDFILRC